MRPECAQGHVAWPVFLRSCMLLMDRLDRHLQATVGLQLPWYEVLYQLDAAGGRLPMRHLAESVMLSKSGITRLVDRMAEAGLIERLACSNDGRVCYAALTPLGRSVLNRAKPIASSSIEDHFARHITEQEAQTIAEALMKVLNAAGMQAEGRRREVPGPAPAGYQTP